MKPFDTYYKSFFLLLVFLTSSCVNDDSFFPEEPDNDIVQSTAVVTTLNKLRTVNVDFPEDQLCFKFVYPIYLGYNNDSNIRVDSFAGLVSVIGSQSANFNVTGLKFPFDIVYSNSDTPIRITNEEAFINVLKECGISTLRDELDRFFNRCFKLDFPVTMLVNNDEVVINSLEEFNTFYNSQEADYQPRFKFPVTILVAPDYRKVDIHTYYGFYRILNNCNRCPQLKFTYEIIEQLNLKYRFTADFPDLPYVKSYSWIVNDQFIENDGVDHNGDNQLVYRFDVPGTYKVCIVTETSDCEQRVEYCKEIVVGSYCPELFFEFEQEPGTLGYSFNASFNEIADITYNWVIDGTIIESDGGGEGDNRLFYTLTPGQHNICIKAVTTSCPQGTEYCRGITVEPICPPLSFTIQQEEGTPSYNFTADFTGINEVMYNWTINGNIIEADGGANGDNVLNYQFSSGTYRVCIKAETDTCPDGTEFCEEIVVD